MKKVVVYDSQFGSTEYYANAIASGLECQAIHVDKIKEISFFNDYDIIILGGCLLSNEISGAELFQSWINNCPEKEWIIYTVGLANPEMTDFDEIYAKNFSEDIHQDIPIFNFRGTITYKRIDLMSELAHQARLNKVSSVDNVDLTAYQVQMLKKYHTTADYRDLVAVQDLINYVKKLEKR